MTQAPEREEPSLPATSLPGPDDEYDFMVENEAGYNFAVWVRQKRVLVCWRMKLPEEPIQ